MNIPTKTEVLSSHPQKKNQLAKVKDHLKEHGKITSWEAITDYKITRLSEYIRQLREDGFIIASIWQQENSKRYVTYTLKSN